MVVMFTKSETKEIKSFKKIPFSEACELTHRLEKIFQEKKMIANVDFYILNEEDDELYFGTLSLGSGYASSIYEHIKKKLSLIKMDDKQEEKKEGFLEQLKKEVPEHLKIKEVNVSKQDHESDLVGVENGKRNEYTSKLSTFHRRMIYGAGIFSIVFLLIVCFIFISLSNNQKDVIAGLQEQVKNEQTNTNTYEAALLGNREGAIKNFSNMKNEKLTDAQKDVYTSLLIDEKKYKEAVELNNKDAAIVENLLFEKEDIEALKEFNKDFPSSNGVFDVAYYEQRWEDVINAKDVNMTKKRYEMKTYAYIKLNKVAEAKKEVENTESKKLNEKIVLLETINKEIADLNKQLNDENKKEKKDDKKIKTLTETKKKKEEERKNI